MLLYFLCMNNRCTQLFSDDGKFLHNLVVYVAVMLLPIQCSNSARLQAWVTIRKEFTNLAG